MTTLTIDNVVEKYVALRDHIKRLDDEHDAKLAPLKQGLSKIEAWLLGKADEMGVDSFKTPSGTAYKSLKTRVKVTEWESLLPFLIQNELTHLLTKAVSKTELMNYFNTEKALPPGVELEQFYEVNVNRPRSKA